MKDRIKLIRKTAGINQTEFAEKIGLTRGFIAQVETDKCCFSDRTIKDICRVFAINEEWLRTGKSEMRQAVSNADKVRELVNSVIANGEVDNLDNTQSGEDLKSLVVYWLSNLDEDDWSTLLAMLKKVNKKEGI